jgi:pteridine reductase
LDGFQNHLEWKTAGLAVFKFGARLTESLPITFPLALVTGAGHRLGREFALHLARQGYAILLHYNASFYDSEITAQEARLLGVPVFPIQADLKEEQQIQSMFVRVDAILSDPTSRVSRLGLLINSAAVMPRVDAFSMTAADFDDVIDLNLRAPFLCAQLACKRMTSGGVIINISDIGAQKSWVGFPVYSVSKAGLDTLTRILARSFAPSVRVNGIAPGLALASESMAPEEWEALVKRLPLQRAVLMEELLSALEFLIKNEYITGQTINIDGGYSLL